MKTLKHYLIPILFICGVIILIVAIINPTLARVKLVKQDLVQLTDAEKQVNDLLVVYDSIRKKYQQITENDKITIEKALPSNVNNVRLILELERIAESNTLGLKDVKIELQKNSVTTALPDNMRSINAQVTVVGTYESFLAFLSDLERSLRIVTIRHVDFHTDANSDKPNGQNEYTVQMETYWFVYPEAAAGALDTPPAAQKISDDAL